MWHLHCGTSARWFVSILVSLLVLGHACELPAFTDLVAPATTFTHGHEMDHHAGKSQIACDAVSVANTAHAQAGPSSDALMAISIPSPAPVRPGGGAPSVSSRPASRPPLFLLHASLLI